MPAATGTPKVNKNADESKADRFKRIGTKRVSAAILGIRRVANLAAPTQYDYTPEQVAKLIGALEAEVASVKARFANPKQRQSAGFTL